MDTSCLRVRWPLVCGNGRRVPISASSLPGQLVFAELHSHAQLWVVHRRVIGGRSVVGDVVQDGMEVTRVMPLASLVQACKVLRLHARVVEQLGLALQLVISNRVWTHSSRSILGQLNRRKQVSLGFSAYVLHHIFSKWHLSHLDFIANQLPCLLGIVSRSLFKLSKLT